MSASYPSSVKTFTTKNTNDVIQPSHVDDLQDEVVAVETVLNNSINVSANALASIKFPNAQVASANINTLDDYEEFTWTPTIASAGGGTPTYTTQVGHYTKIGRLVFVHGAVQLATKNTLAPGNVVIGNLPFTSFSTTNGYSCATIGKFQNMTSNVLSLSGYIEPNTTSIQLSHQTAAGTATTDTQVSDVSATVLLVFSAVYITAT